VTHPTRICCSFSCPSRPLPKVSEPFQPLFGFKQHPNSSSSPVLDLPDYLVSPRVLNQFFRFESEILSSEDQIGEEQKKKFIEVALRRYECYLWLLKKFPDMLFVPTIEIEMCWRSHLLRPDKYLKDTERIFGKLLPHVINPSTSLVELHQDALANTSLLWKKEFGVSYLPSKHTSAGDPNDFPFDEWYEKMPVRKLTTFHRKWCGFAVGLETTVCKAMRVPFGYQNGQESSKGKDFKGRSGRKHQGVPIFDEHC
jgi:hypothetical protein